MKDWYEELARLVGRAMADEWMKIIARRHARPGGNETVESHGGHGLPADTPPDADLRKGSPERSE